MNKEVHYEGWLIKSPPTKRIWRARWRRRWFTLKQGEIPEQFCLEYYTDRNCRKLKGVIDLDQCEQVDCGLRLENRKQKFQYMFDIKTPKRTYYLAADTETDMRDWVNCICQVCHLHDTKQSNELQDDNRSQTTVSTAFTNSTNNTTTTTFNSSAGTGVGVGQTTNSANNSGAAGGGGLRNSFSNQNDILRRPNAQSIQQVVEQQPLAGGPNSNQVNMVSNNSDSAYVNTDYSNRETLLCDARLEQQHQQQLNASFRAATQQQYVPPASPGAALYLNSSVFYAQAQNDNARLAINANGVVRKIPENLVLNNTPLPDAQQQQQNSIQPSPALSTASGPYIPISECFSGSPKFIMDGNNPSTPLNNLDPKFYDTPRSHNNIGLNLTNDQSYSPKITNCSLQQLSSTAKERGHRSDSDSESVFTDDDEWAHPLPLRENVDRSTRPSDSSVENESFVVTYSQRFSKLPDDTAGKETKNQISTSTTASSTTASTTTASTTSAITTTATEDRLAKVLKNKNVLSLDFKENEKIHRDLPQLSDTENTSPAIGPRDATSVVEESYDIPRSHNLPYYNMCQLYDKMTSPDVNPIAASTPNLISTNQQEQLFHEQRSSNNVKTLPRPHCYTNAAPTKVEGNVFRYDFIEQGNLPPVNRKLKPKVSMEDKPPEESPAKPPVAMQSFANTTFQQQQNAEQHMDPLANKIKTLNLQNQNVMTTDNVPLQPPTVDRKLKPYPYKFATTAPASRRSTGAPLSMCIPNEGDTTNFVMETRTLPRQPRPNYATSPSQINNTTSNSSTISANTNINSSTSTSNIQHQHQRTVSATAALPATAQSMQLLQMQAKNEHKLQYFELDIANAPAINRHSLTAANNQYAGNRFALPTDPSIRAPNKSTVVYNSVDFVKTEAFKRIREERKKESECVNSNTINNNNTTNSHNNNK